MLAAALLLNSQRGAAQQPPPPEPPPPPPAPEAPVPPAAPQQPYAQAYAQPQPAPQPAQPAPQPAQPAPQPAQPAPAPQPAQPQPAPPPQAAPQYPPPQQAQPAQPAPQSQPYAQPYGQQPQPAPPQNQYGPPPPRPQPQSDPAHGDGGGDGGGFDIPPFAVRVDPFNWLLHGRFGLEIEVGLVGPLTVELVPVFVTDDSPAMLHLGSIESEITQESDGLGSMSGASLGLGVWLNGSPFRGSFLRAVFTNYAYSYAASDSEGQFDGVSVVERRFVAYFGSTSRFGPFTIGGAIGLGYELNQQERCGLTAQNTADREIVADDDGVDCRNQLRIALDRDAQSVTDLNGFAHPVYLEGRFSLGFAFD